jgi:protein-tyrosine phosphatase
MGVRTAIDLREPVERELDPPDLDGTGLEIHQVPLLGEGFDAIAGMGLADVYRRLLEHRGRSLASAVGILSEPGALPALVFCSAGKDRTGLVTALVLAALGAPDETIVADYAQSGQAMAGPFGAAIEARALAAGISEQELAIKLGAPPAAMREVLAYLRDRHGGAAAYLLHNGVTRDQLDRLAHGLVEPASPPGRSTRPVGLQPAGSARPPRLDSRLPACGGSERRAL